MLAAITGKKIYNNLSNKELIDLAVETQRGVLTPKGALVVKSGKLTGRAANDKYVVMSEKTRHTIDWRNNVGEMTSEVFLSLKNDILDFYKDKDLFTQVSSVGADDHYNMNVSLVTTEPQFVLFMNNMFRKARTTSALKPFAIYHAPFMQANVAKYNTKSETVVAMNLDTNEVIIIGTRYAGEIKKSIFSIMNYILPEHNLLPMHAGSNRGEKGDVSVFFGLSGTGKTTLSTDTGRHLIGDDEHGLSDEGIFNFEGGCYAKTYKLSKKSEPEIYNACETYGALMENVALDENNNPLFDNCDMTENGRVSYPLSFIPNIVESSRGEMPDNIFFLSADAFGVLPAISKLNADQAKYYFLSGYTAKLAGTEVGVKEPQAAFSTCFGAPFMMRHAKEYAALIENYITKNNINVWLVNTGWSAGGYGVSERFPIHVTRGLIRSAQAGKLQNARFETDPMFGLSYPQDVEGISNDLLNPAVLWTDKEKYTTTALKLKGMFENNFKKYSH